MPSAIFQLCDDFIVRWAKTYPLSALYWGLPGYQGESTDLSPEGAQAQARLRQETLDRLDTLTPTDRADRLAADFLRERLSAELAAYRIGEHERAVRPGFGPVRQIHNSVNLLPQRTDEDWQLVAATLRGLPETLTGYRAGLDHGLRTGRVAARRQAVALAEQLSGYATSAHQDLLDNYGSGARRAELDAAVTEVRAAYRDLAQFLTDDYAPGAAQADGVGAERHQVAAQLMLGARIDPVETYAWAWDELRRIEADMAHEAARVTNGGGIDEAVALLDTTDYVEGADAYRDWLQQRHDQAIADLADRHFDIDPRVRTVDVRLSPDPNASAPYYITPSEDLSRAGTTWWPTNGRSQFALWSALSVVFHEGVPGHHLQGGQRRVSGDRLSRFSKLVSVSGNNEGWALYAERLADELGWFETPGRRLGMLLGSALRATRVVVDLGVHLGFPLPAAEAERHGPQWTFETTVDVLRRRARLGEHQINGEALRYFGWPAQASCYKLGERAWLAARTESKQRLGGRFSLRDWHTTALDLGPLGLDQLSRELRAE